MTRVSLLFLMLISAMAIAADESEPLPFHLPVPDGWKTETIPFPLDFAPELEYEGLEELRFAPGMFDSTAVDFWSYAFVWWVEADELPAREQLEKELVAYWDGLARVVAPGKGFDMGDHESTVTLYPLPTATMDPIEGYSGKAHIFESFVTGRSLDLNLSVRFEQCPEQGRHVIFVEISPQPNNHEVWATMESIRKGFACGDSE